MAELTTDQMLARAREVIETEARAVSVLKDQLSADLVAVAKLMLNCQGHILAAGAGTSCAMAQRFAHLLACCGTPALFISAANAVHGGAGAISENDLVYIISKGGQSEEINTFAQIARDRGATIVAHTERPDSPLAKLSDAMVHVAAPQGVDPYGMIATGSSLMNGAVCDVLCVLLLELRGYTQEQFGHTHPGGAVGAKLEADKRGR
jgi:arabinose-5-phosphate isomerase